MRTGSRLAVRTVGVVEVGRKGWAEQVFFRSYSRLLSFAAVQFRRHFETALLKEIFTRKNLGSLEFITLCPSDPLTYSEDGM